MSYLYAISRTDLPVHQQAIQSAHAQLEYMRIWGSLREHPTFVWLTVSSKIELLIIQTLLEGKGIKVCAFTDPDYEGYQTSAISCLLSEDQRHLLSDLKLWNCYPPKKISFWQRLSRFREV